MTKRKQASKTNRLTGRQLRLTNNINSTAGENVRNGYSRTQELSESHQWSISLAMGIFSTTVYIKCLYPSISGGDSGELVTAAQELGVAHPPGYPLFTLMSWLTIQMLPVGSIAWRVNLQTAILAGAAVVCLSKVVLSVTGRLSAGVLAVGIWSWCKLTWTWSVTAEVFSLNNLFISLLMLLALYQQNSKGNLKVAMLGAFVCGLSLCNQHTMIIYVVCLAVWVLYWMWTSHNLSMTVLVKLGLCFLAGLSPYLYLPLSSYLQRSRWTWGDQRTLWGLLTHLLRMEYGTFDLGKEESGKGLLYGISCYAAHVIEDMTLVIALLFVIGIVCVLYRNRNTSKEALTVFLVMMFVYIVFFSWRANLDISNPLFLGVVERFWMQSNLVVVTVAAVAYSDICSWVSTRISDLLDKWRLDVILAVMLSLYQLQRHYRVSNQSGNTVVVEFGHNIMKSMPTGALVLTKGDLPSNILRYLYLSENVRHDIQLFDQEVLTYDWSVPMLGWTLPNVTFPGDMLHLHNEVHPDGRLSFNFLKFLDVNYQKGPIFGCIGVQGHEDSWKQGYELWPFGPCHQFVKKGDNPDVTKYAKSISEIGKDWKHPYMGFSETSWERVATNEMWHAEISGAFFLYEMAESTTDVARKSECIINSYQLYTTAIENNAGYPSYWDKNYALVCERMLHVPHDYNTVDLVEKAIGHFQTFLKHDPNDRDREAILEVVQTLSQQLNGLKSTS